MIYIINIDYKKQEDLNMKRKILSMVLLGIMVLGVTGTANALLAGERKSLCICRFPGNLHVIRHIRILLGLRLGFRTDARDIILCAHASCPTFLPRSVDCPGEKTEPCPAQQHSSLQGV